MRNVERFSKISKEEIGSVIEHPMTEEEKNVTSEENKM